MDIYKILHEEHVAIAAALEHLKSARVNNRKAIVAQVVDDLTAHSLAEDQVLYDRLLDDQKQLVLEAKEEHAIVSRLLEDLRAMRVDDERFEARVKVLLDVVKHHVDEEENEMFPLARAAFDDVIAKSFAGEYVAAKAQLMKRPQIVRLGQARLKKALDDVGHMIRPG